MRIEDLLASGGMFHLDHIQYSMSSNKTNSSLLLLTNSNLTHLHLISHAFKIFKILCTVPRSQSYWGNLLSIHTVITCTVPGPSAQCLHTSTYLSDKDN